MERWARINYQPSIPLGENGTRVTGSSAHIALSRRAAADGMVLVKNEGRLLPLKGKCVALFGRGHIDYIKGGGGSGSVRTAYTRNLYEGLAEKEAEGKLTIFRPLSEFYAQELKPECDYLNPLERKAYAHARLDEHMGNWEPQVPAALFDEAAKAADVAILTISRYSCEKYERLAEPGDYYLSEQEQALFEAIKKRFSRIAVVMNIGGATDTSWFAEDDAVQGAVIAWQSGIESGLAVADVLCGDVCPSGKLTDTFTKDYFDYPSAKTFAESDDYVNYYEDIYNGYRWFETIPGARERVVYPFGFGLSYTTFAVAPEGAEKDGDTVTLRCTVKNTGKVAGREVVQAYLAAPQGKLGKAAKSLVAFAKTDLLQPDEAQTLTLSFRLSESASYDDLGAIQKSAFVLEQGEYTVYLGTSVRDCTDALRFTLAENEIVRQCKPRAVPKLLPYRYLADGTKQPLPPQEGTPRDPLPAELPAYTEPITLFDVAEGRATVEQLVGALTDEELVSLLYGHNAVSVSPTNGIGGGGRKSRLAIPLATTGDGPAGLRIPPEVGMTTTAFPCATQLACTWDVALVEEVNHAMAQEVKENNIAIFLSPALNVHRDPLCGRNFEYFSEDPLISGMMAAASVRGIQSLGIAATIKHFACYGKETNRRNSDSRVTERALREIWLRAFEITLQGSTPWALMTAYNRVNGDRTSQQYDLITGILRGEWGWDGLVMTDWHVQGLQYDELLAGNDVKMPENLIRPQNEWYDPLDYLKQGLLPKAIAQQSAKRILELILKLE